MTDSEPPWAVALRDQQEIRDTLARFCLRVDEYDVAGLVEVFTEDCFTDYGPGRGGPVTGRDAVLARIARGQSEFRRTHHQLGQCVAEPDGDTARACTYVTATHEDWEGVHSRVHLRYLDGLRRMDEGWRIASRVVEASVVEGFPGVPWSYVARAQPVR